MKYLILFAAFSLSFIGCRQNTVPQPEGLMHSASTLDSVAIRFIDALNAGDTALIGNLVISEQEHNILLLPEFHMHYPAATPDQAEVIWDNLSKRILKGTLYLAGNHMQRQYSFSKLEFLEPVEEFKTFRIHTNSLLTVRDSSGTERKLALFGSVVERNGQFKILSYREP